MKQIFSALVIACMGLGCGGGGGGTTTTTTTGTTDPTTGGGGTTAPADSSLQVNNNSSYSIHYLYMSSTAESSWGPDQLGSNTIPPGSSYTLNGVPCGDYDVKLVDEDGDECELRNVHLCSDSALVIDNQSLLQCEGYQ